MKINILVDNKKSWFASKAKNLAKKVKAAGHRVALLHDHEKIPVCSDITFFLSYEKFIAAKTRSKSRHNIVIHASDLPRGRGMSPTTWQIIGGKNKIPVTLFEVADKFDAGDYYLKDNFILDGTELIDEWREKLYQCLERMALKFIKNCGMIKPLKQTGKATIYRWRTPADSRLDINRSIKKQFNLLRVVDNERYPAFFEYRGKKYILKIFKDNKIIKIKATHDRHN